MYALITGISGNLGSVWRDIMQEMDIDVQGVDLPDTDVSNIESINKIIDIDKVDILVNNAAIDPKPSNGGGKFWRYDDVIDVNLKGAINMCYAVIPGMIESGGGLIVNIGSIMGNIGADWRNYREGFDKAIGYNVSKCGLIQLSRSICTQYGRYNIRAVTISFGPVDIGLPEEFKLKFLRNVPIGRCVSNQSLKATLRYVIECPEMTGQQILIDGGYTAW